ncbi:hypothetical protein [Streptomyces sp. NPDC001410]|uniref:hypothetical protein n=1 Tax=Streptomyces sp. NPDC001410 TaxID=3364574 RepID=UPI0036C32F90
MNDTGKRVSGSRRKRFEAVHKWAATATAVLALAISLYNFTQLQRKPRIDVALPHLVRIEQGKFVILYIQPTLSTRFKTEKVEVISDVRLKLHPTGSITSSKRPDFYWRENSAWGYEPSSGGLTYRWAGDPAPFVVSQDKPQQPTIAFEADGWNFQPGRYEGSLQLHRSGRNPLVKKFCLVISKEVIDKFRTDQRSYQFFRNDVPRSIFPNKAPGCYEFFPFSSFS